MISIFALWKVTGVGGPAYPYALLLEKNGHRSGKRNLRCATIYGCRRSNSGRHVGVVDLPAPAGSPPLGILAPPRGVAGALAHFVDVTYRPDSRN